MESNTCPNRFDASQATNLNYIRFSHVVRSSSQSAPEAQPPAYRVEPLRASDAIGLALRDAFERELGLPDDMAAMLRRLHRCDPHTAF